jgi:hypothetical protein
MGVALSVATMAAFTVGLLTASWAVTGADAPQPIPYGKVAVGDKDVALAWFAQPTGRYPHGVLGDDIEAGELVVRTRDGTLLKFTLEDSSVFEDLTPRLADIDADGRDEIWAVRSNFLGGARLEAYGIVDGALVRRFSTRPIGIGFRWLNLIGVADFDGDGQREVAYIETPHIGGILTVVTVRGDELVPVARQEGYSTHSMGSVHLDLAAVADVDADGAVDFILPDQSRSRIAVVSLVQGELVERWRSPRMAPVGGGMQVKEVSGGWRASYRSTSGVTVDVMILSGALR